MDPERQEFFEERAAIMEYDGKMKRGLAERKAMLEVLRKFGAEDNSDTESMDRA